MNRFTLRPLALAFALLLGAGGPLGAEDTHTTHSKQMKSDTGVKEGEEMKNAPAAGANPAPHATTERCQDEGKTHITHSKQMKNDAGVKEGEEMDDADCVHTHAQSGAGKPAGRDTHTTHDKQMKNDQGVKEGERMKNAP